MLATFLDKPVERRGTLLCLWWRGEATTTGEFSMDGQEQDGHSDPLDDVSVDPPVEVRVGGAAETELRHGVAKDYPCAALRSGSDER